MTASIEPGTILAGKFRVDQVLGQGGMGVVVAAHHLQLDEQVAIKFLLPNALGNPEAMARFTQEARACVKIKSEHVARVSDIGTLDNGAPYIVMERLIGSDLAGVIREQRRLSVEDAVDYVLQALEAVAEAHALGIVHRDLKPSNLFLVHRADGSPCVKVLDFGISKMIGAVGMPADSGLTQSAVVMGSPLYMSPEQLTSARDVDARTDIWALGAILYELLSGRPPFHAASFAELCTMVLTTRPDSLRALVPEIPTELDGAVLAALERDRDKRISNASELAQRIVPFAPKRSRLSAERVAKVLHAVGIGETATPVPQSSPPPPIPPQEATMGGLGSTVTAKGHGAWLAVAVVASCLVAGAVALIRFTSPDPGQTSPASVSAASAVSAPPVILSAAAARASEEPRPIVSAAPVASASSPSITPESPRVARLPAAAPGRIGHPKASVPRVEPSAAPPQPSTKPNCEPNYYFDKQGEKHFKAECF